jgi:predicted nucleotidyltransferase
VFQKILRTVARELKQASIPYMMIGGQAVLIYGEPRLTRDIDVTLGIGVSELARIKKVLPAMGLKILVKNDREFVERTMVLPTKDRESEIRVDFIFSFSPYERQAIGRARDIKVGRTQVKFASLEDVVIHKVISGRPRDLEDIKSILVKNPKYDSDYISGWLKEFDRSLNQNFLETFKKTKEEIRELESRSRKSWP